MPPTPVSGKPSPYNPRLLGGGAVVPYVPFTDREAFVRADLTGFKFF